MKLKTINELTIKEYYEYIELISDENVDYFSLIKLFGYKNVDGMTVKQLQDSIAYVNSQKNIVIKPNVKKYYIINDIKYEAILNLTKIKAGQFIDLQIFLVNNKLEEILSVFLIPMKKTFFGWKSNKYNDGYDLVKIQDEILNNFTISDAKTLSDFFLFQSKNLLTVIQQSLEKKMMKKMK